MRYGVLVALLACVACHSQSNHYRHSVTQQEKCCGNLKDDAAQAQCVKEIPRLDLSNVPEKEREEAETSQLNQETYRCVDENFQCDKSTGRATPESAQAQLDCVNSLESTASTP